ncbi:MAG: FAD-dependent oxidoreductase [Chloroflexi bacterium]|nr:FAD-dependent oxidoreductase [Chloroflexota bacterium]
MVTDSANYDVIIIGGGPAGLTAGLYTSRGRLNSLLIISGYDLGQMMHEQATKYGLKTVMAQATGLDLKKGQKIVNTTEGNFSARTIIIAGGSERQKLGVPGEEKFTGKGVSYCATCDAAFFKEQPVAVVGGGNAAITEALHLAKFASRVTVIHRRHELRATRILQARAFAEPKITFLWDSAVAAIEGQDFVKRLGINQVISGQKSTLEVAGIFVAIGFMPDTAYLKDILSLDTFGHIITNENMETALPGILAAGDIRHNSGRQAITAAGDGATAAIYAERFLTEG